MLSSGRLRFVRSLHQKKFREKEGLFLVEGPKLVHELIQNKAFAVDSIYATSNWRLPDGLDPELVQIVTDEQLARLSVLDSPNRVLAVCQIPASSGHTIPPTRGLTLLLDQISDPGNLGTIIRTADWFGVSQVFCSPDSAELFNPKVIQATMGSVFRMKVFHTPLIDLLVRNTESTGIPVYAAVLGGENVFQTELKKDAWLLIGNESRGVSPMLMPFVTRAVTIPSFAKGPAKAESLNVSVATGILCAEFLRGR
ncbi:MAG: hypothetical protein RLZZ630_1947 [Bacteroidota bacterium]|jgi:TrmH family RNA methyltransferase